MVHPSSISARQIGSSALPARLAAELDNGHERLRHNVAEFRGVLKHVSVQTDVRHSSTTMDECEQADFESQTISDLQRELQTVWADFKRERERASERERMLIAQMNAVRDSTKLYEELKVCVSVISVDLNLDLVAPEYTQVILEVRLGQQSEDEATIATLGANREITMGSAPFCNLQVNRNIGQVSLLCVLKAKGTVNNFPIILSQIGYPPFIPSLKQRGHAQKITVHFPEIGQLNTELIIT